MYNNILNPINNKWIKTNTNMGKRILFNYVHFILKHYGGTKLQTLFDENTDYNDNYDNNDNNINIAHLNNFVYNI